MRRTVFIAGSIEHVIDFAGSDVHALSMKAIMSICNMEMEAGAHVAMVTPDGITAEYLRNRPIAPTGEVRDRACGYSRSVLSNGSVF